MKLRHGLFRLGACALLTVALAARAASPAPEIAHASGRIGDDDPIEIEAMRQAHNLQVVFALKGSGSYLADVGISIYHSSGEKVLVTRSPGPFFFATLGPGQYRIDAEFKGKTLSKSFAIGQRGRRDLYFYWETE
ncbi:MAG TPA: carboxypeptidase regulatory-like domain-containing protein [Accumulibacter sp.]|uniref:carboxypeptidase regulatory-like domain-containing protein n=1 Tax=Accumulibacter sp. TaxID=2053492 RepID=UPI0025FF3C7C|nr:carboxypeptidase regulatory-like domain-containing protein [Accumulibacter sp.]MCM8597339.1 carboxypeptidase regulatory-like domain-containing protein [Accumulibacter sp.]MCM8663944.1 carboxypeptidase regulatory-like domain-containing protein [Accumulibacter sp.]HNC51796.1 carboxypeptidase regulatory-like domain-containing protein [Accumulibacter sp.]